MAKNKSKKENSPKKTRTRNSTRPRSARQIAQQKTRNTRRTREPSRSQTRRPQRSSPLRRKARAVVLVGGMALFGFLGVLFVDAVVRVQDSMQSVAFMELWDKMLNRFLDNDVPRQNHPSKKQLKASTPKAKVAVKPKAPRAPELKPVTSSRADLQAPSPKEYARATRGAVEEVRKESHDQALSRLDRIISGADL